MIKIGSKTIDTNIFLAPLAGCSDLSFRLVAREEGARFCFFEMVDSNAMLRNTEKTLCLLKTTKYDRPIAAQLLGGDEKIMLEAAKKLLRTVDVPFLDINSACPVKKVIKKRAGAYLLEKPKTLYKIVKTLSSELDLPITVKLRIGYSDRDTEKILRIAEGCEKNGALALFLHGRAKIDSYGEAIDYKSIGAVKRAVSIPVFGIGNIMTAQLAKKMFDETGCDGIMVARGSFGNPWIFKQIEYYLKTSKAPQEIDTETRKKVLKRHLAYVDKYKDSNATGKVGYMRKIAMWYLKGFPYARKLRDNIVRAENYKSLVDLVDNA